MHNNVLQAALDKRKADGLLRSRKLVSQNADGIVTINGKPCLNFASNDYLGLSQHPDVLQSYAEGLALYGAGSTASSVVSGYMQPHKALEDALAQMFNKEAALLFNSGFAANQALIHALFSQTKQSSRRTLPHSDSGVRHQIARTDTQEHGYKGQIICDKLMHASFIEGALHANARLSRFRHNDAAHMQKLLDAAASTQLENPQKAEQITLLATEGVFSMDGDIAQVLTQAQNFKRSQKADKNLMLMIDDAHGFGVIGKHGLGVCEHLNIDSNQIDIIMATFGKAIGTAGAFIAGSKALIDFLINFARHYVYSTAIPPAQAHATLKSIEIMQKGIEREKLQQNIALFKSLIAKHALPFLASDTAIQPLIIADSQTSQHCTQASEQLMEWGIYTPAIRTPTVAKGKERLRITLSALHSGQDIQTLVDALCILRERQNWSTNAC
uniref:aminotransferase class I/II-fold pyridoxal phosphate-dependent enzyme n=1 Tax=Ningiella ruwaisensis TaxID=2364274 RepID=UPI00109EE9C0|nr:8-amino-7-oxononanoate synthase [Ningiella ruwaisensis]